MEAFSELVDPAHFEQVYDSVEEAEQFLRDSYDKTGWKGMGSWTDFGCIPVLNTTSYQSVRPMWLTELR